MQKRDQRRRHIKHHRLGPPPETSIDEEQPDGERYGVWGIRRSLLRYGALQRLLLEPDVSQGECCVHASERQCRNGVFGRLCFGCWCLAALVERSYGPG